MLTLFIGLLKFLLSVGVLYSVWNLIVTRLLMPKIFWLIALFIQVAFLLLLHGIEFISFVLLILYVGAISVLFLFVVMILNPDAKKAALEASKKKPVVPKILTGTPAFLVQSTLTPPSLLTLRRYDVPQLLMVILLLVVSSALVETAVYSEAFSASPAHHWVMLWPFLQNLGLVGADATLPAHTYSATVLLNEAAPSSDLWIIAETLYTQDFLAFWLVGLILLVAMVGAILLTLQKSRGVKRQKATNQCKRYYDYGGH
jgi:NADH:ubiquinone oxidoreductase subunit 6 (subunit J)